MAHSEGRGFRAVPNTCFVVDIGDVAHAVDLAESHFGFPVDRFLAPEGFVLRALALVSPDSHEAGRLLPRCAALLYDQGNRQGAQEAFERALAIARSEGDLSLETQTLLGAARVDYDSLRPQEAAEKSIRALELARQLNDWDAEANAHRTAFLSLRIIGDPVKAHEHARAMLSVGERLRDRSLLTHSLMFNLQLSILEVTGTRPENSATVLWLSRHGMPGF